MEQISFIKTESGIWIARRGKKLAPYVWDEEATGLTQKEAEEHLNKKYGQRTNKKAENFC